MDKRVALLLNLFKRGLGYKKYIYKEVYYS
jgi:hypothetical protein